MFCGSCMKDNTLAAALCQLGHDAQLIPTYTPIRTDEDDVSQQKIFLGGINVYLQQKSWLFRHTPRFIDRLLNGRGLLRWVSRFAVKTKAEELGDLTVSMLQGKEGKQVKAIEELVDYLCDELRPDCILVTNLLLSGFIPEFQRRSQVPVFGILQGDDIFLESLPSRDRQRCIELIASNCRNLTGFFATCNYYADFMAQYLNLDRPRIQVVYPGIRLKGHGGTVNLREQPPYTIGYFARICPEKGFHQLIDAFIECKKHPAMVSTRLKVSGWLGENQRPFFDAEVDKLKQAGFLGDFEHVECPKHEDKVRFLQSVDLLSVPTTYREPKGLYLLEAWANGVPVVQPAHGSFPELIERSSAGIVVPPNDPVALAGSWRELLLDAPRRRAMSESGRKAVAETFHAEAMARETVRIIQEMTREKIA